MESSGGKNLVDLHGSPGTGRKSSRYFQSDIKRNSNLRLSQSQNRANGRSHLNRSDLSNKYLESQIGDCHGRGEGFYQDSTSTKKINKAEFEEKYGNGCTVTPKKSETVVGNSFSQSGRLIGHPGLENENLALKKKVDLLEKDRIDWEAKFLAVKKKNDYLSENRSQISITLNSENIALKKQVDRLNIAL
jgi:hypothetical protein